MIDQHLISHAYCIDCRRETSWVWDGGQNTLTPQADFWRCRACSHRRLALGNVPDTLALCRHVLDQRMRVYPRHPNLDYEDALGHLQAEVWELYLSWDPGRCASFLAYACWKLPRALSIWHERQIGRDDPENRHYLKVTAFSVSLDAIRLPSGEEAEPGDIAAAYRSRLGGAPRAGESDPGEDRDASLRRAVDQGNRAAAREEGILGVETARRAKGRDQVAT